MNKTFLFLIPCCLCFRLAGQTTGDLYLQINDSTIIGKISGNHVQTSENSIDYTLQGNIIFIGESKQSADILFMVNAKDIMGKKAGIIYQKDSRTVQYISIKGTFYFGDYPIDLQLDKLLTLERQNDSVILVKSGIDDSLLGKIAGTAVNAPRLAIAAHLYITYFELDRQLIRRMEALSASADTVNAGSMRLLNTGDVYFEWQWDGKILEPVSGNRPEDVWEFDGKYLRQSWNIGTRNEWVWENSILKPAWENNPELQWHWEKNILRNYWVPQPDQTWILEDNRVRPMWSYNPLHEWEITGNIPLPVIALVVLGIADRP